LRAAGGHPHAVQISPILLIFAAIRTGVRARPRHAALAKYCSATGRVKAVRHKQDTNATIVPSARIQPLLPRPITVALKDASMRSADKKGVGGFANFVFGISHSAAQRLHAGVVSSG
jgi:hypothetical protein